MQSNPRTVTTFPAIDTRSTTEDAIGFGRYGRSQGERADWLAGHPRHLNQQVASRSMHPIQDLDPRIGGEAFQGPLPPRIEFDLAFWSGWIATPGTDVSGCPVSSNLANKIDLGVQLIGQYGENFA